MIQRLDKHQSCASSSSQFRTVYTLNTSSIDDTFQTQNHRVCRQSGSSCQRPPNRHGTNTRGPHPSDKTPSVTERLQSQPTDSGPRAFAKGKKGKKESNRCRYAARPREKKIIPRIASLWLKLPCTKKEKSQVGRKYSWARGEYRKIYPGRTYPTNLASRITHYIVASPLSHPHPPSPFPPAQDPGVNPLAYAPVTPLLNTPLPTLFFK